AKGSIILKRFRQAVPAAACSGRLTADWRHQHPEAEGADKVVHRVRRRIAEGDVSETLQKAVDGNANDLGILDDREVDASGLPEVPASWSWLYLPQLGYLNRGRSRHRPRNAPHLYGGPYPFIQTGDIAQSGGRITSHKQTYSIAGLAQSRL